MASVWVHDRRRARKLKGQLSPRQAMTRFQAMVREWRERGGSVSLLDGMEALMFAPDGKLVCGLYVELLSPPTAPEPGQPKRETTS